MRLQHVDLVGERPIRGTCLLLPGRQYTPDQPLLRLATGAAQVHGWNVRQVWWNEEAPERGRLSPAEEMAWVEEQTLTALHRLDAPVVIVAKSLGTLAAPLAEVLTSPAVWLTPLLNQPPVIEAMLTFSQPQLTLIGDADPLFDQSVLVRLPGTTCVVPGDHVLETPGDPQGLTRSLGLARAALDTWFALVETPRDPASG